MRAMRELPPAFERTRTALRPATAPVAGATLAIIDYSHETMLRLRAGERAAPSPEHPRGCVWIKATNLPKCTAPWTSSASPPISSVEARAIKREAGFKARRWVVERTHSWLNRFRRILVRWDKSPDNYIAFLHFACALIAFRAAGLLG